MELNEKKLKIRNVTAPGELRRWCYTLPDFQVSGKESEVGHSNLQKFWIYMRGNQMMNFTDTNSPIYSCRFREQKIVKDALYEESWMEWGEGVKKVVNDND